VLLDIRDSGGQYFLLLQKTGGEKLGKALVKKLERLVYVVPSRESGGTKFFCTGKTSQ